MAIFTLNLKRLAKIVLKTYIFSIVVVLFIFVLQATYGLGYSVGFNEGQENTEEFYLGSNDTDLLADAPPTPILEIPDESPSTGFTNLVQDADWGGPDLWEAVNARRQELGVNPLSVQEELCTIASIRLNQLLELGKLDGHAGFSSLAEDRPDLESILNNYSTMAEFLAAGGQSAEETVGLWENSLGYKQLMTGGEYVWGCIYAQNSFAVAIAAF